MLSLFALRCILLAFGVLGLLAATVLFEVLVRRPIRAWLRLNERLAGRANRVPRPLAIMLDSEPLLRAWQGLCAVVLLVLWWYLGTAGGVAWWASLAAQAPR